MRWCASRRRKEETSCENEKRQQDIRPATVVGWSKYISQFIFGSCSLNLFGRSQLSRVRSAFTCTPAPPSARITRHVLRIMVY